MLTQGQLEAIQRTSAVLRHRNKSFETIWMHSAEDGTPNWQAEVYNVDRKHPGRAIEVGLNLVDALLPLFGVAPMGMIDDRMTPYSKYVVQPTPMLSEPMKPVIGTNMLWEAAQYAAVLWFETTKLHIRYCKPGWREDKNQVIEHPEIMSARHDMRLVASMINTLVSHLGGAAPLDAYDELPSDRRYSDYERLAELIAAQSQPAKSAVVQVLSSPPNGVGSSGVDLNGLIAVLLPLLLQALVDYLSKQRAVG